MGLRMYVYSSRNGVNIVTYPAYESRASQRARPATSPPARSATSPAPGAATQSSTQKGRTATIRARRLLAGIKRWPQVAAQNPQSIHSDCLVALFSPCNAPKKQRTTLNNPDPSCLRSDIQPSGPTNRYQCTQRTMAFPSILSPGYKGPKTAHTQSPDQAAHPVGHRRGGSDGARGSTSGTGGDGSLKEGKVEDVSDDLWWRVIDGTC